MKVTLCVNVVVDNVEISQEEITRIKEKSKNNPKVEGSLYESFFVKTNEKVTRLFDTVEEIAITGIYKPVRDSNLWTDEIIWEE